MHGVIFQLPLADSKKSDEHLWRDSWSGVFRRQMKEGTTGKRWWTKGTILSP